MNISGDIRLNANYIPNIKKYAVGKLGYYVLINDQNIISGYGRSDYGQYKIGDYITGVKQIVAGGYHTVLLFENGRVSGFGRDDYGQATLGNNLTGVQKLAAGMHHTLALLNNGRVTGWGQSVVTKNKTQGNFPFLYDRSKDDISKAGYTNNITGVIDIAAGDQSSYAIQSNNNITGWGMAKWIFADGYNIINYPINIGPIKKITAGNNFVTFLLNDSRNRAISLRHYAQPTPNVQFGGASIFDTYYDCSFRGAAWTWSGYVLNDYIPVVNSDESIHLTGIIDISAGIDYTMAILNTGLISGWGYEGYSQINFYNKSSLNKPKILFTGAPPSYPTGGIPAGLCYNPSLVKNVKRLFPENTGFFKINEIEAGWNITAALNSGSGLTIIGDQNEFLFDSDFKPGGQFIIHSDIANQNIFLNQFATGHCPPKVPDLGSINIINPLNLNVTGIYIRSETGTTSFIKDGNQTSNRRIFYQNSTYDPRYNIYYGPSWHLGSVASFYSPQLSVNFVDQIIISGAGLNTSTGVYNRSQGYATAFYGDYPNAIIWNAGNQSWELYDAATGYTYRNYDFYLKTGNWLSINPAYNPAPTGIKTTSEYYPSYFYRHDGFNLTGQWQIFEGTGAPPTMVTGVGYFFEGFRNINQYNAKLIPYTGHPSGILKDWPYGTKNNPSTGANVYNNPIFQILYLEDRNSFPKACLFYNGLGSTNSWMTGLNLTGNFNLDNGVFYGNGFVSRGIFGFIYTGSSPSLGVNNFYFQLQGFNSRAQINSDGGSLFNSIPTDDWRFADLNIGPTGGGIAFTRYLTDIEYNNYQFINKIPDPIEQKEIFESQFFESNKILMYVGQSKRSCGYSIYRKTGEALDYMYFSGINNPVDGSNSCLDGVIHEIIDYSPEYGNPPIGTIMKYKIYPYNNFGSGDPIFLESRLVELDC